MRGYVLRESLGEGLGCDYLRDFAQDEVLADTEPLTGVFRILRHRKQVFVNMLGRVGAVVARADLQKAPARPSCRSATSPRCERWQTTLGDRMAAGVVLYLGEQTVAFGPRLTALPLQELWKGS